MSTQQNRRRPSHLPKFGTDCGKAGHARAGCQCDRCAYTRGREMKYQRGWQAENEEHYKAHRREYLQKTGNAGSKKYEKTPKGYLMRSYRNMESRVKGIQKAGSWTGKEILPREDFYEWALNNPTFLRLFRDYEASSYDRKLAPSPDRIDSSKGYALENMRWLTHSENSARAKSNAKLTRDQVLAIRAVWMPGMNSALAKRYGVTYQNIEAIVKRRTWRDL